MLIGPRGESGWYTILFFLLLIPVIGIAFLPPFIVQGIGDDIASWTGYTPS
jgi:hypothetical protein